MGKKESQDRRLLVSLPIRVKTYDIDFVGHVNNIVYVRWLEDLRLQFLDTHLPLDGLMAQGVVPVVVNTEIHYRQAIVLNEHEVLANMWVRELGKAVFYLGAEFVVGDEVRCSATQRGTFVNTETGRPVRVPEELRNKFAGPDG